MMVVMGVAGAAICVWIGIDLTRRWYGPRIEKLTEMVEFEAGCYRKLMERVEARLGKMSASAIQEWEATGASLPVENAAGHVIGAARMRPIAAHASGGRGNSSPRTPRDMRSDTAEAAGSKRAAILPDGRIEDGERLADVTTPIAAPAMASAGGAGRGDAASALSPAVSVRSNGGLGGTRSPNGVRGSAPAFHPALSPVDMGGT